MLQIPDDLFEDELHANLPGGNTDEKLAGILGEKPTAHEQRLFDYWRSVMKECDTYLYVELGAEILPIDFTLAKYFNDGPNSTIDWVAPSSEMKKHAEIFPVRTLLTAFSEYIGIENLELCVIIRLLQYTATVLGNDILEDPDTNDYLLFEGFTEIIDILSSI